MHELLASLNKNHNYMTKKCLYLSQLINQPMGPKGRYIYTRTEINHDTHTQTCKQGTKIGCVPQSVTCLATDARLAADPGDGSLIPARPHTFVEIDHEMISTVILLPSADSFKKDCCQLQAKVCARSSG